MQYFTICAMEDTDLSSDSDLDALINCTLLYAATKFKRKKRIWKSSYLRKRETHGEFRLTSEFSDDQFTNYFRMNRMQFEEVHNTIQNKIYHEGSRAHKEITTKEKLAVFLRYLASGNSYKSIGYSYRLGDRTVSKIVNEVSAAIWECLQQTFLPDPTEELWKQIAKEFEQRWQFPHCVGSIDGKHIVVKKPAKSGSSYFNYKHTCSIVLMATVDANYKFITVDIGSMGRFSDGNIFSSSILYKKIQNKTLKLPEPDMISGGEKELPYVFVGDEAFPLLENLMRPYPKRKVTANYENKVFNYRLSRARQTVECAFGILAGRFHVFRKPFEIKLASVDNVVKAACVLHNYLRMTSTATNVEDIADEELLSDQLTSIRYNNSRNSRNAFLVRENYTHYFNTTGAVQWQRDSILRGKY
ncbi:uncharacterized protein [Onthophagus taurus]|uniref:uncharacterized protein n=1 Tax=Onthophagus taurus TaxID=166361 RepID=UPI0039BE0CD1